MNSNSYIEQNDFVFGMMVLGGFCNAYTFMTRGGVFANGQTANMAKVGASIILKNWSAAFNAFVPIMCCFLGALLCEAVKHGSNNEGFWLKKNWPQATLFIELIIFFIVGFIPTTFPHAIVNALMSLISGFQLSSFKSWKSGKINTTICTGNLRSLAIFTYDSLRTKDQKSVKIAINFLLLSFSFTVGAGIAALATIYIGIKSIWIACTIIITLLIKLYRKERFINAT